jgi:hypothetical protein
MKSTNDKTELESSPVTAEQNDKVEYRSPLMTAEQIALLFPKGRGSKKTVELWWAEGVLPSVKVGRFRFSRRSDVAALFGISIDELP